MSGYVHHPRLVEGAVESRGYQLEALSDCLEASTLLVLPTGLGKTPVEWMAIAERLERYGGKAVMTAPTNALVDQHRVDLMAVLRGFGEEGKVVSMTGSIDWKKRSKLWDEAKVIVATPQVIRNDVNRGSIDLSEVTILVVDEAHHATGNHAAAEVGDLYRMAATEPLVLGATASPGSTKEQVQQVCTRLGLKRIHHKDADHPELSPYAAGMEIQERFVEVDEGLRMMAAPMMMWLDSLIDSLRRLGYHVQSGRPTTGQLNETRKRIQGAIAKGEGLAYNAARNCAQAQRILNLVGYLLSQGVAASREYLERTQRSGDEGDKGAKAFVEDQRIKDLRELLSGSPELHEKVPTTVSLVVEQLQKDPASRVIVFAHFRDTVDEIVRRLGEEKGVKPLRFVGQAKRDGSDGMTQKEQNKQLDRFRRSEFNVLVATSVGEEGLDIPKADRVVFYEPVPSEIRTIQRRGRTGRHREGSVFVLIAKETRDEGARRAAQARERKMTNAIAAVRRNLAHAGSNSHDALLSSFEIATAGGMVSAADFVNSEKKRLAPELGKKRTTTKTTVVDIEESGDENMESTKGDSKVDPQRLRPKGQIGLESFPPVEAPELESLPNVGTTTAKILMERFESIEEISKSTVAELCEVAGISPATAESILTILRG